MSVFKTHMQHHRVLYAGLGLGLLVSVAARSLASTTVTFWGNRKRDDKKSSEEGSNVLKGDGSDTYFSALVVLALNPDKEVSEAAIEAILKEYCHHGLHSADFDAENSGDIDEEAGRRLRTILPFLRRYGITRDPVQEEQNEVNTEGAQQNGSTVEGAQQTGLTQLNSQPTSGIPEGAITALRRRRNASSAYDFEQEAARVTIEQGSGRASYTNVSR
ncbi:hypothetical protein K470DRAFT_287161 [Piedraia hortae CBS 480.64]|uniref:Uncharacterized protein n=1 Tax=Piedraia hortae CBS 480.64 TaxID=1314780 RepID=A0A6A7C9J5_9PEZI|nr:hypothetical protein K470DRAFT_287161 [Piedraia hortae CBS 480.64]